MRCKWVHCGPVSPTYTKVFLGSSGITISSGDSWCAARCLGLLSAASNFSAGAGDCLTGRCIPFVNTSLTEWGRRLNAADSVVDKNSLAYTGGEITGGVVGTALLSAGGATAAAIADGKNGAFFGRGVNTVFNSSKVRFGWAWKGSSATGRDVIRLGIGAARGTNWWNHIIFWVR